MAGSNGVQKFAEVNRDDQIINLKTRGGVFSTEDKLLLTGTAAITAQQYMFNEIQLDGTTPSVLTLDTMANILKLYALNNKLERGSTFRAIIMNTDPNNTKTLTLPANMTFYDTGASSIAIPPGTRLILTNEITSITGTSTISVYPDTYSGISKLLGTKQCAIPVPVDYGQFPYCNSPAEMALWTYQQSIPNGTTPANNPSLLRTGTNAGGVAIFFPLRPLAKLASNTSPTAGFVLTSVKLFYIITCQTDATSFGGGLFLNDASTYTGTGFGVGAIPFTSNLPAFLKPATPPTGSIFTEILTLTTPLQITENTFVRAGLYSSALPNANCGIRVSGAIFYGNYQYWV